MLAAFLVVGLACAAAGVEYNGLPTITVIASFRSSPFINRPLAESFKFIFLCRGDKKGMEAAAAPMRSFSFSIVPHIRRGSVLHYGIGGLGTGGTPQTADAQGGRGGVGIRNSLPWVAAEPPFMQAPVKVSLLR